MGNRSLRENQAKIKTASMMAVQIFMLGFANLSTVSVLAQASGPSAQAALTPAAEAPGTSTDLFVMGGSDFDRPGLLPRARSDSVWIQESYNKVVTVPWYTTTSAGYTYSW